MQFQLCYEMMVHSSHLIPWRLLGWFVRSFIHFYSNHASIHQATQMLFVAELYAICNTHRLIVCAKIFDTIRHRYCNFLGQPPLIGGNNSLIVVVGTPVPGTRYHTRSCAYVVPHDIGHYILLLKRTLGPLLRMNDWMNESVGATRSIIQHTNTGRYLKTLKEWKK